MARTLSDRLCAVLRAQMGGRTVRPPEGASILWNAFMQLSRARSCGPAGPNPIGFPDIAAWSSLMRMPLEPHHVVALTAMDRVWMEHAYRREDRQRVSGALSPAALDAMFG
ncbi:phage tail assembly chaperone [Citreimonas sp.]|uniref:phage tail assembly chaperone n=1 Tax=Citreimonas sp. TaxID=3036715 RepID=UPI004058B5EF